jgi:hypothetical protein
MIRISYRRVICDNGGMAKPHLSTMHTPQPEALA